MKLSMRLGPRSYDIILKRGALDNLSQLAWLDRPALIVTDSGVPAEYARRVAGRFFIPLCPLALSGRRLCPCTSFRLSYTSCGR